MEKQQTSTELKYCNGKETESVDDVLDAVDHSLMQKPLQTGIQNVLQILKCMKHGTTEVRHLILRGCNIIYECKTCNSLYRSLANFLLHKRFYCKNETQESLSNAEYATKSTPPDGCSSSENDPKTHIRNDSKPDADKPMSSTDDAIKCEHSDNVDETNIGEGSVSLQDIASKSNQSEPVKKEKPSPNTKEAHVDDTKPNVTTNAVSFPNINSRAKRLSRRKDCSLATLMCLKCNTKYTSIKTLYFHMITIHSPKRQYYPCPYCDNSFVQMWGVTRHLTQVHNKTKDQVDRLKEVVRRNAFTKKEYSVSKHLTNTGHRNNRSCRPFTNNQHCKQTARINRGAQSRLKSTKYCVEQKVDRKKIEKNIPTKLVPSSVIEKRVRGMIDAKKLVCLKCRRKFSTFSNLRRHAAIHAGWTRYMCQRCCYQSYNRSDCRTHIQRMHASPEMNDLEKFIVNLPSVKVSVTKVESLNGHSIKPRKRCRKVQKINLLSKDKRNCNDGTPEKCIEQNGFTNSDNILESLVTRSKKYPKIQGCSNSDNGLCGQQTEPDVNCKEVTENNS